MSSSIDLNPFFDFSNEYLLILEGDTIANVNTTFCKAFGYERTDLVGNKIDAFLLAKDLEEFQKGCNEGNKVRAQILSNVKKAIQVEWSFQASKHLVYVKGIDITEKLRHQERFEQYSVLLRGVNESLEKSSHRLYLLQSALTNTLPYAEEAVGKILEITLQTLGFSTAVVTRKQKKGYHLVTDVVGLNAKCVGHRITRENTLSWQVFQGEKEIIQSINKYSFCEEEDYMVDGKFYLGFPLTFNNVKFGTIEFILNKETTSTNYDNNDIQFLKLIADVVGRVIELQRINSDLKEKSKKLENKNNELDEFAHIVSHDLKAPLRAIKNLITFIGEDVKDGVMSDESKEDFKMIDNRATRMTSLIDGVLEYSRVGREETPISDFNLNEIVHEVADQLKPMNEQAEFKFSGEFPEMKNKELFMFQLVSNLVSNAIKYNDKLNPIINIGCLTEGNQVKLWVEDNGPGIPVEYREKVFGVFETLQGRDEVESTGIGLTIVKKMALQMGGDATIEDSELGGAKFVCTFSQNL